MEENLVVKLTAETGELKTQLASAVVAMNKASDQMNKKLGEIADNSKKQSSVWNQAWGTMLGVLGSQAVTGAIDFAKQSFKFLFDSIIIDGVKAASETQAALSQLSFALEKSGITAQGAIQEFESLANAIQNTSKFGDDAALSAATLIQNLARLDKEGLKVATQSAVDFAAAMNIDLETAARVVGKAMDGNTESLKKYGITVEEGTTKAQTMANVLQELNSRFGGAGAKQLETWSGSLASLNNVFSDFTKVFGNAIIDNKVFIAIIGEVRQMIIELTNSLDSKVIADYFAQGTYLVIQFAQSFTVLLELSEAAIRGVSDILTGAFNYWIGLFSALKQAITGDIAGAWDSFKNNLQEIAEEFTDNNDISKAYSSTLERLAQAAETGYGAMISGANGATAANNGTANSISMVESALKNATDQSVQFAQTLLDQSATLGGEFAIQSEMLKMQKENDLITEQDYYAQKLELLNQQQAAEQELLQKGLETANATQAQRAATELELAKKQGMELTKLENERKAAEKKANEEKLAAASQTFGNLAVLAQSGNKTLAGIGKASAISQATIDGYAAVQKALSSAPPPFNFALAASVGIATAANVAKIASTPLATGIDSVPGIGSADNFPAILAPGERVVPKQTNQDLTRFLNGQGQSAPQITVNVVMNDVFTQDARDLGLKIINVINETASSNGIKILGSSVS